MYLLSWRTWKRYPLFFLATLVVDWFLGAARFAFLPGEMTLLLILFNFPLGILFLALEKMPSPWWQGFFGRGVNDEIGQAVTFLLMVVVQAAWFTALFAKVRQVRESGNDNRNGP